MSILLFLLLRKCNAQNEGVGFNQFLFSYTKHTAKVDWLISNKKTLTMYISPSTFHCIPLFLIFDKLTGIKISTRTNFQKINTVT